jgi:enoyl-CoA hydratase/carnithine racemase
VSIHQSDQEFDMDDIVTEHAGSILRVQLNRPTKRNAMTSAMYVALAGIFTKAANDDNTRVVLWHGAGESFCAGNDIEDFLKNPPGPGESPQAALMKALVNFDKPLVAAVRGAAVGGGTTMLTHCDFIYAAENAKFQMPFINLALVPEFGSSWSVPARIGHLRAAESDRDGPEIGNEAGRGAASQQEAHEAAIPRADQGGDEGRERGVQRASPL